MRPAGAILLLCAAAVALPTHAQTRLLVVTEQWPPFRIETPLNRHGFSGVDIDVLELMEQALSVRVEVQRHPFARCLEMMRSGQADLITGIARTEERAEYIEYVSVSYAAVQPVFYTQKGRGQLVRGYQDLYGRPLGFSTNSAYFEPFNSDKNLTKVGVSTEAQLVQMLALGRLELIIGTNPNLAWDIRRYGFADLLEQVQYVPEQNTPLYLGLSRRSPHVGLSPDIAAFLQQLLDGGEMARILARYR